MLSPSTPTQHTSKTKNVFAINSTFFIFSFHGGTTIHRLLRHSQPIHCFATTAAHFVSKTNLPTSFLLATENLRVFHSSQICLDCFSPVALSKAPPNFFYEKFFTNGLPFSKFFVMYERKHQKEAFVNG